MKCVFDLCRQLHTNFVEQEVAACAPISCTPDGQHATEATVFSIAALLGKCLAEVLEEGELVMVVKWVCYMLRQFST